MPLSTNSIVSNAAFVCFAYVLVSIGGHANADGVICDKCIAYTYNEFWANWIYDRTETIKWWQDTPWGIWASWISVSGWSRTCGGGKTTRARQRVCGHNAFITCVHTMNCQQTCLHLGTYDEQCHCTDQYYGECCEIGKQFIGQLDKRH